MARLPSKIHYISLIDMYEISGCSKLFRTEEDAKNYLIEQYMEKRLSKISPAKKEYEKRVFKNAATIIDEDLYTTMAAKAAKSQMTVSSYLRMLIMKDLEV